MSRGLSAASLALAAAASAGVGVSVFELRKNSELLERMDQRLLVLEKSSPAAVGDAARPGAPPDSESPAGVETLSDAIREVRRLREDMDSLKSNPSTPASPGPDEVASKPPTGDGTLPPEEAQMRKVVEDVLAQKEKDRQEAEKKRQEEWMNSRLQRTMNELTEKLGLSAQQRDQISVLLGDSSKKQMELWQNRKEGENPWQKSQELRKETDTAVKALLTAEQQVKYDEVMRTQWGGPRMMGDGGGPVPGGGGGGFQPR
jgi:hypothetical protein